MINNSYNNDAQIGTQGKHLLIELWGCNPSVIDNEEKVKDILLGVCDKIKVNVLGTNFHKFTPQGISGVIVISESHISIHCASEDTEILTIDGWKKYTEAQPNEIIMTYNMEKDILEYQELQGFFISDYDGVMYNYKNQYLDMLVTPEHKCLVRTLKNKNVKTDWYLREVKDMAKPSDHRISAYQFAEDNNLELTEDFVSILAWVLTDGSVTLSEGKYLSVSIYQSPSANPNYVKEIDETLERLGLEYTRKYRERKGGFDINKFKDEVCWRLNLNSAKKIAKYISPGKEFISRDLLNISTNKAEIFINSAIKGDGSFRKTDLQFSQKSKSTMDFIQELAFRNGYRAYLRVLNDIKKDYNGWSLTLKKKNYTTISKDDIFINNYLGKVFCPQVKNKTWVARRNNKIFITGNSWPEEGYCSMDFYTCGDKNPTEAIGYLLKAFEAKEYNCKLFERGNKKGIKQIW